MKIVAGGKKKSEILGGPAEGCPADGCPAEGGFTGNGVQGSWFRVQFRFFGAKTEIEQKQKSKEK